MVFIFLALLIIQCLGFIQEKYLFVLSDKDYDSFIETFNDDLRVILFYSPFSSPTHHISEFFQASKELASTKNRLAKVDITKSPDLQTKFQIRKFPHIQYCLAKTNICKEYREGLSKTELISAIKQKMYNFESFYDLEDFDEYLTKKNQFDGIILGVFSKFAGEKYEAFLDFAKDFMDVYKFGLIRDEGEWTFKFNLTTDSVVLAKGKWLHSSEYPNYHVLSAFKSFEDVANFVSESFHPYISYITQLTEGSLKNPEVPFGVFYIDFKKYYSEIPNFVEKFTHFSRTYTGAQFKERKFQWAIADTHEFKEKLIKLGLGDEELFMLLEFKKNLYKINQEDIIENGNFKDNCMYNFYTQYNTRKYPYYYNSQPLPQAKYENGIRVAVGSNILNLVENKDIVQAVFVYDSNFPQFYEENLKILEKVAKHYKSNFKIEFIKIDENLNYVPEFYSIMQYSKLFFAEDRKLNPSGFSEVWSVENLIEKIESIITLKVDL